MLMEKEKVRDLFTCRNCQWGDQCPAPHNQICEYYDSISELEADIESHVFEEMERHNCSAQLKELMDELEL